MSLGEFFEEDFERDTDPIWASANLSGDGRYRYTLCRQASKTDSPKKTMLICGYNPSIADADVDDPTIRREIGFAIREGCTHLLKINTMAAIATDPRDLDDHIDPVGPLNEEWIDRAMRAASDTDGVVVAAWGVPKGTKRIQGIFANQIKNILPKGSWRTFGLTKDGHPRHPLYLKSDTPLEIMP